MSKKQNAEEDYITTPISVLSYITDLERQLYEARELLSDIHQSIEHLSMSSDNGYTLGWCDEILVGIEKRLKEQG